MGAIEYADFVFCVTHLDHMSIDARKAGAELITNWALEHYGTADKPVFLVGDFNCTPDEETIRIMEKNWNRISAEENTYPCPRPTKCIDYIFALKNGVDYVVGDSGVILSSTAADVTKASDHYPVYVDVRLNLDAYKGALDDFDDNQVYTEAIMTR
jgi:endonuclease/exonuclease/phosphatase family metal-dependent hydrolase